MTDASPGPDTTDGRSRRDYLRWLIALAVAIPVAVESRTLIGMIEAALSGEDADALAVGGELLPSTASTERVTELGVRTVGGERRFHLAAEVTHDRRRPYEVGITTIYLDDGTTLDDPVSVVVSPGETRELRGEWAPGARDPTALDAVGRRHRDGGTTVVAARRVALPAFES